MGLAKVLQESQAKLTTGSLWLEEKSIATWVTGMINNRSMLVIASPMVYLMWMGCRPGPRGTSAHCSWSSKLPGTVVKFTVEPMRSEAWLVFHRHTLSKVRKHNKMCQYGICRCLKHRWRGWLPLCTSAEEIPVKVVIRYVWFAVKELQLSVVGNKHIAI